MPTIKQEIVVALSEAIGLMKAIDETIEKHGGRGDCDHAETGLTPATRYLRSARMED